MINKEVGETPLEAIERFRDEQIRDGKNKFSDTPMTYAGRLDPMATGSMIVLVGEECKKKEKYLGLDKEYEVEILFGISTDTYDTLGLIEKVSEQNFDTEMSVSKYIGKFIQKYPAYSSKTVNGKQLHEYARAGALPEEMPEKEVEIYEIEKLGEREKSGAEIAKKVVENIAKVKGDFRQSEIVKKWKEFGKKVGNQKFKILKIRVKCSSGTYMRSLAHRIGGDIAVPALAYSIHRTKIYDNMSI